MTACGGVTRSNSDMHKLITVRPTVAVLNHLLPAQACQTGPVPSSVSTCDREVRATKLDKSRFW